MGYLIRSEYLHVLLPLFFLFFIDRDAELHASDNSGVQAVTGGRLSLLAQLSREALPHTSDSLA